MLVELYRVAFDPLKEISFISDEYNKFELEGSLWPTPPSPMTRCWASSAASCNCDEDCHERSGNPHPASSGASHDGEPLAIKPLKVGQMPAFLRARSRR